MSGETLPYLGRRVRMVVEDDAVRAPEVRFRHWSFEIKAPRNLRDDARREAIRKTLVDWYRERAAVRLNVAVERWAPIVGCEPSGVLIRDQKSRWASCAPDGTLRFKWRAVMAEPSLIDYIVVHELVHLEVKPVLAARGRSAA